MLVIVPTGKLLQATTAHLQHAVTPFCFSFPPEINHSSASWQMAALLVGAGSLSHPGTPLLPDGGCRSQAGSSLPCPSVTRRTISSIHHLHLSAVAWRLVPHCADAARLTLGSQSQGVRSPPGTRELGGGLAPRMHLARGAWALLCLPTQLPRASPLLCSHQQAGIF